MQYTRALNEEIAQNRTLERRNEELIRLLDAWQSKAQGKKPTFIRTLNMHEVENLIIRYYQVYKVPVSLYDEEGKLLFSIGWRNVCLKYHKNSYKFLHNCKTSIREVNSRIADINSYSFKCNRSINSIAVPITVQKEVLGTLVVNQFLYKDDFADINSMKEIAYENGINIEEYRRALSELPMLDHDEVEKMAEHYILFSEMISFIASHNIQLAEHQNITREKAEICSIFREKLEDQAVIIKSLYQFMLQQNQEIDILRNELALYRKKNKVEYKEKSLVEENQPG